uniref:U3 small nucleolar RNA-associated protein 6 homolog C-terminal domain-containing protein n=1 Tax=Glossina morsitans morsitans TaxID=37546 RepID=A0A1B0GGJ7_GLOMM
MAEFVEEIRERLLPEYEQMKTLGICPDDQIRETKRKRENLLNKIFQSQRSVADYADFIRHEKLIHKWITEKERSQGQNLSELKHSIVTRIIKLYREGLRFCPNEERLWDNFIMFSKKSIPHEVTGIYEKMLAYHGDKPTVWCNAGIWVHENVGNIQKVKEIFFRALQRHPDSEALNITFFIILLKEASKMSCTPTSKTTPSEQELGLERAALVYRNSKTKISNVFYFMKLLKGCEGEQYVNITASLQKEIIDDLMINFSREESVWDALAQRELQGLSMIDLKSMSLKSSIIIEENIPQKSILATGDAEKSQTNEDREDKLFPKGKSIWQVRTLKRRIELCVHVYQVGVRTVPTATMFSNFINAMLKLNQDLTNQPILKRKCLAIAFKEGHTFKLMNEDHYYACIKMLLKGAKGVENATKMLTEATHLKKTLLYYEMWMVVYMTENNDKKFLEIFRKAKDQLEPATSVSLWRMAITFFKTRPSEANEKFLKFFKDAAMQLSLEFAPFRADYLEYISATSTLDRTRREYDELSKMPPPCLELHRKMADVESKALSVFRVDKSRWRKCYENATHYFGKTNSQVWIDYIKFERDQGDPKNMAHLYERAKSTLDKQLVDNFMTEFTLLKAII